jgi:hypothetical protein
MVDDAKIENYFSVSLNNGSDNWGPLTILKRLVNAYSDIVSHPFLLECYLSWGILGR